MNKLLQLIRESIKVDGFKINILKSILLLRINNNQLKHNRKIVPSKIAIHENTSNKKCTKRVTELRIVTEELFICNNDNKESLLKMIDSCSQNVALKINISKLNYTSPLTFIAILEMYFRPLNNRV